MDKPKFPSSQQAVQPDDELTGNSFSASGLGLDGKPNCYCRRVSWGMIKDLQTQEKVACQGFSRFGCENEKSE